MPGPAFTPVLPMKMLIALLFAGLCLITTGAAQDTYTLEVRVLKLRGDKLELSDLTKAIDDSTSVVATVAPLTLRPGETVVADETKPATLRPLSTGMQPRTLPIGTKVAATLRLVTGDAANIRIDLDHATLANPDADFPSHTRLLTNIRLPLDSWYFAQGANRESSTDSEHVYTALRLTKS